MKAIKFRLLATIFTLAAVTTALSVQAQRRSTGSSSSTESAEKSIDERPNSVRVKSGSIDDAYERRATEHTVRNQVERNSRVETPRNEPQPRHGNNAEQNRQPIRTSSQIESRRANEVAERESRNAASSTNISNRASGSENTERQVTREQNSSDRNMGSVERSSRGSNRVETDSRSGRGRAESQVTREQNSSDRNMGSVERSSRGSNRVETDSRSGRVSGATNRERYNLNNNDERYQVNRNYRGSNNNWTSEMRTDYSHGHKNLKSGYHNHWNNSWEHYRWSHDSWINYYNYYDRYSYCNHKYYYHHSYYGHVIRRFMVQPVVFSYYHYRYYCYDGHFFRYRPGVGYILVDIPYGMTFEYLPDDFERVYINGYLYYRVNNLFFEYTTEGFQLIHYPERYYAYDADYCNDGFGFSVHY